MEGLFDSIMGLPVHPLVVHAAVALLPLSALSLIVAAFSNRWRARFGAISFVLLTIAVIAAFVAKESGEALTRHIGTPVEHAEWADKLVPVAIVTWLSALAWMILQRRRHAHTDTTRDATTRDATAEPVSARRTDDVTRGHSDGSTAATTHHGSNGPGGLARILGLVTALLSLATIALTVIVGHSGATATWADAENRVKEGGATQVEREYSMTQVAKHASASSCWTVIDGGVYDVTTWISQHPGGSDKILSLCGKNGSQAFNGQHSQDAKPKEMLKQFRVGKISDHDGDEG